MNALSRRRFLSYLASALALAAASRIGRIARAAGLDGGPVPGAAPPSTDDALARVAAARASLRTLVGPFTQERTIGLLATKVRSTGTMVLVRPDHLRWELAAPDDVVYWVGPEGLAYRTKSGEGRVGAVQSRVAASLDDLRTLLGGDLGKLRDRYELRARPAEGDAAFVFDATPRDPRAPMKQIRFGLGADASPRFAELVEGPRDRTRIDFGALQRNVAVDPALLAPPRT